jgi:hypothetical protein
MFSEKEKSCKMTKKEVRWTKRREAERRKNFDGT